MGRLWETVVSFANLHEAARRASLGIRKRLDVARFLMNVESELVSLRRELKSDGYRTGPYREFLVHEAKPRLISAAPFRDRAVRTSARAAAPDGAGLRGGRCDEGRHSNENSLVDWARGRWEHLALAEAAICAIHAGEGECCLKRFDGGACNSNPRNLRVSNRNNNHAVERNDNIGFHCVRDEERRCGQSS